MVPDIDLQLQTVIRALSEVVAPAVSPQNQPAIEQLHLSIATLKLLKERVPLEHARARVELTQAIALAEAMQAADGTRAMDAAVADSRQALADPAAGATQLDERRRALLALAEAAVAAAEPAARDKIARAVVAASRAQLDLARAWCLPAGFETSPGSIPPLDALLAQGAS